jgi:hypothetical protein
MKYQAKNTKYIFQFFRLVYPIHYARVVIAAGAQSGKRPLQTNFLDKKIFGCPEQEENSRIHNEK